MVINSEVIPDPGHGGGVHMFVGATFRGTTNRKMIEIYFCSMY